MKKNILIFVPIVLLLFAVLFVFDTPLWHAARDIATPDVDLIARLITNWGLYLFYAIFAALLVYSFIRKNQRINGLCRAYIKAQLLFSFAVVRFFKIIIGRPRPDQGADFLFFSLDSRHNAFPSGHSADAFVSGLFLYYMLRQSKYAGSRFLPLIYAFLIAVSRIFVSAHYPSDVAAGMAIGIMGAWFFLSRLKEQAP